MSQGMCADDACRTCKRDGLEFVQMFFCEFLIMESGGVLGEARQPAAGGAHLAEGQKAAPEGRIGAAKSPSKTKN